MNATATVSAPAKPYLLSVEAVAADLRSNLKQGLKEGEAAERLKQFGANELTSARPVPAWRKFVAQFADTLVVLLLLAALISGALWLYERDAPLPYESLAILSVVLLNAILGYVQEARAEAAVAALRAMSAAEASVIRDGQRERVAAKDIVPGDLILVEEGDTIPADARLIRSTALQTAEAALTGESLPVSKDPAALREDTGVGDQLNMLFSGTAATYGRGTAIVTATGMQTEMGRIAGMLEQAPKETTPLQRELDRVGKLLGVIVIVIALVMIGTVLLVEDIHGIGAVFDVLIMGVALAVAAVPEGLPAVVTAVLAMGVQRMAKRKAIVRHLSAVETLGSASVVASDKTGTLTKNEMTVRAVVTASGRVNFGGTGYAPTGNVSTEGNGAPAGDLQVELERALTVADRASNATVAQQDGRWTVQGDPTEGALLVAARKAGLTKESLDQRLARVGEVPFSSERKLMTTVHTDADRQDHILVFTKGAPDILLALCNQECIGTGRRPLSEERRRAILRQNDELAGQALRTLGVAARELSTTSVDRGDITDSIEEDLGFLGLIGMIDPPRDEARLAVERAKSAGIRPIMITGDHPSTASVIAVELGISPDGKAMSGAEIQKLSDDELAERAKDVSVFARVSPDHKLRIVRALKRRGAIVAMTGDGVNDAPALKTADIGVAMGITGTDVSKQAADIVLVDDNFATIVSAIEEGRSIFENIRKFLRYLLSSNIGEVMTMFFGVLLAKVIGLEADASGLALPLLATQILWINLVTDGAPALALGVDPPDEGVMHRPPRPSGEPVITLRMWMGICYVGVIMAAGTLLVLDASMPGGLIEGPGPNRYAQTMAFTTLVLFQLFNVFNARSDEQSAFHGLLRNPWLMLSVGISLLLHMGVLYLPFLQKAFSTMPLSAMDWFKCIVAASSVLWLRELTKLITRLRSKSRSRPHRDARRHNA